MNINESNHENEAIPEKPSIEALYHEYYQRVYKRVMYFVHNPEIAEDITQDIFVKLCRVYPRMETISYKWFYTCATNRAIDELRKALRGDLPFDEELINEFSPDPAETVEMREEVREVLSGMTPERASILVAYHAYKFKLAEIAQAQGKTPFAVKTTHMRTMHALRKRGAA